MSEKGRREEAQRLALTAPVVRRHGLPRQPTARRLGTVRFAPGFVAAPAPRAKQR